jgi:hypothetical protein
VRIAAEQPDPGGRQQPGVVASLTRGAAASRTNCATVRVARTAVASDRAKVAVRRTVGVCPSAFGPLVGPAC